MASYAQHSASRWAPCSADATMFASKRCFTGVLPQPSASWAAGTERRGKRPRQQDALAERLVPAQRNPGGEFSFGYRVLKAIYDACHQGQPLATVAAYALFIDGGHDRAFDGSDRLLLRLLIWLRVTAPRRLCWRTLGQPWSSGFAG